MFDLGQRMKMLRMDAGMSQEKLAWAAGITPAFVGQIERNIKSPTVKTLEKLADALNISVAEIFSAPVPYDAEQKAAIRQINYQLREMSAEEVACMSGIADQVKKMYSIHKKPRKTSSK